MKNAAQSEPTSKFPSSKGIYVFILFLKKFINLTIGKLGTFNFPKGFYAYAGSALGSRGLRGRINHHLGKNAKTHWHVDYLKNQMILKEIWLFAAAQKLEHKFVNSLDESGGETAVKNFGSGDCSCGGICFTLKPY